MICCNINNKTSSEQHGCADDVVFQNGNKINRCFYYLSIVLYNQNTSGEVRERTDRVL